MPELEPIRLFPTSPVEVAFGTQDSVPFRAIKTSVGWQLKVNETFLQTKGFTGEEIQGACALEQERLRRQVTLDSSSSLEGLRRWRDISQGDRQIQAFKTLFERVSAIRALDPEKAALARQFLTKFATTGASSTEQLFASLLASRVGETYQRDPLIENVTHHLEQPEEVEGRSVSTLDSLTSPTLSYESKALWFENRFLPWLQYLQTQDKAKKEAEEAPPEEDTQQDLEQIPNKQPQIPPPSSDQYEQHRGRESKGEAEPIFVVDPFLDGYFESDSFDVIDERTGVLKKTVTQTIKGQKIPIAKPTDRTHQVTGLTGDNLFSLPLVQDFHLTPLGLDALRSLHINPFADAEGHIFLKSSTNQQFRAEITHNPSQTQKGIFSHDTETAEQTLSQETEQELDRVRALSGDSLEKAREWRNFVQTLFTYPQDEQVKQMYQNVDNQPSNRLKAMTIGKLADCFLAREFFLAGLKRLGLSDLEWRAVNGYFVKSKTKDGTAWLHSGNAHAWAKVRLHGQKDWFVLDPTPKGDPIKEGKDSEQPSEGGNSMDDFQDLSPEPLSEDQMAEIQKEITEKEQKAKQISPEEKWLKEFADQTGLPIEEVRKIKETLDQVDQMTDSQGRNILRLIKEQIDKIIQRYTQVKDREVGLVRMSQGQTLEDPVAARLDLQSGVLDPTGFNRTETRFEKQEVYGGFDTQLVIDGSGSMAQALGGKVKYKEQQKMVYLMLKALHYFAKEAERRKLRLVTPLKVRSEVVMFQGNRVEVVKPLGEEFTPIQQVQLWKRLGENIGGGTPDHLGLQSVLDEITPQEVQLLKDRKLLKIVSLVRDGGSDNPARVAELTEQLRGMNAIVADFLITDGNSLDRLPESIASQVIGAITVLMPQRVKRR